MFGCFWRNVSAAVNPAGPLPMAMNPGATTSLGYHRRRLCYSQPSGSVIKRSDVLGVMPHTRQNVWPAGSRNTRNRSSSSASVTRVAPSARTSRSALSMSSTSMSRWNCCDPRGSGNSRRYVFRGQLAREPRALGVGQPPTTSRPRLLRCRRAHRRRTWRARQDLWYRERRSEAFRSWARSCRIARRTNDRRC